MKQYQNSMIIPGEMFISSTYYSLSLKVATFCFIIIRFLYSNCDCFPCFSLLLWPCCALEPQEGRQILELCDKNSWFCEIYKYICKLMCGWRHGSVVEHLPIRQKSLSFKSWYINNKYINNNKNKSKCLNKFAQSEPGCTYIETRFSLSIL